METWLYYIHFTYTITGLGNKLITYINPSPHSKGCIRFLLTHYTLSAHRPAAWHSSSWIFLSVILHGGYHVDSVNRKDNISHKGIVTLILID